MRFASRHDAGRQLGEFLLERGVSAGLVLGLPRGGVAVAAEVARIMRLPLDVLIVRKIGHPFQRELAVGALAEPDVFILDDSVLADSPVARFQLDKVIEEETARLREYRSRFSQAEPPSLKDKSILLVDDGLATGATAEASVMSAVQQGAERITVAAPVASSSAIEKLKRSADQVVALFVDPAFEAVCQYYDHFDQTTEDEVIALLAGNRPCGG
jgi:putative phosphoribosyl transferase